MTRKRRAAPRRLGRPPASDALATKERILHTARLTFAELGYAATTNKHLAASADVTTGAIYHYFESKLDLYRAVNAEAQSNVCVHFEAAVNEAKSFVEGVEAVLDVAHELNNRDPSLARFLGAVRIDVRRNPELRSVFKTATVRREKFIENLVEIGVKSGELDVTNRARTIALIRTMLIGLVDAVSDDPATHRAAVDALKLLIEGKLIRAT